MKKLIIFVASMLCAGFVNAQDLASVTEIYNSGIAPLTINSFSIDAPFTSDAPTSEFTVDAKEKNHPTDR